MLGRILNTPLNILHAIKGIINLVCTENFPKNEHFSLKICQALFSCYVRLEIRPFALLLTNTECPKMVRHSVTL